MGVSESIPNGMVNI